MDLESEIDRRTWDEIFHVLVSRDSRLMCGPIRHKRAEQISERMRMAPYSTPLLKQGDVRKSEEDPTEKEGSSLVPYGEHKKLMETWLKPEPSPLMNYGMPVRVVNVVVKTTVGTTIPFSTLLQYTACVTEFKALRFAGGVALRVKQGNQIMCCLIFQKGSFNMVGYRCVPCVRNAVQCFRQFISSISGTTTWCTGLTITNMVCSCRVPHCVNLAELVKYRNGDVTYEPKRFPGAIARIKPNLPGSNTENREITVLVFEEGSVIIMGVRDIEETQAVLDHMSGVLYHYKMDRTPRYDSEVANAFYEGVCGMDQSDVDSYRRDGEGMAGLMADIRKLPPRIRNPVRSANTQPL